MSKTELFKVYEPRKTFIDALLDLLSYLSACFLRVSTRCRPSKSSVTSGLGIQVILVLRTLRDDSHAHGFRSPDSICSSTKILGFVVRDPRLDMQLVVVTCDQDPEFWPGRQELA
jgi:hypothetical protein